MPQGINAVRNARSSAAGVCIKTTRRARSVGRAFAFEAHAPKTSPKASESQAIQTATERRDIQLQCTPTPNRMLDLGQLLGRPEPSVQCFDFSRRTEFCDLARATDHYVGMVRAVWGVSPCFALAVQLGCGLETVELGGPIARASDAGAPVEVTPQPVGDANVSSPNTEAASGELTIDPSVGADGLGSGFPTPVATGPQGCTKVDFLFVIDNSFSMVIAQDNLKNSFDGFMTVIGNELEAEDFHIMVVDTDAWDEAEETPADGDRCRDVLGAGRRSDGDGLDCGLPTTERFVSLAQPELLPTFQCMASVGNSGSAQEQPIAALLAAASTESRIGGCNEGFFRSDALLVVTIITNSDDNSSLGDPQDWYASLLSLKRGDDAAFVVLGFLGGDALPGAEEGACQLFSLISVGNAPRLQEFVGSFGHSQLASVCARNYAPHFETAVSSIDTACTAFIPR